VSTPRMQSARSVEGQRLQTFPGAVVHASLCWSKKVLDHVVANPDTAQDFPSRVSNTIVGVAFTGSANAGTRARYVSVHDPR